MFCTRPPSARPGGVIFCHVLALSRVIWNGPSLAPTQITPRSSGDSRIAYTVEKNSSPVLSTVIGPPE